MAKTVTILAYEGDVLRGVRVAGSASAKVVSRAYWRIAGGQADPGAAPDGADNADRPLALAEAMAAARKKFGTREVAIAMPLDSVILRCLSLPAAARGDAADAACTALEPLSPFPDTPLSAGFEPVSETETEIKGLAAAVPEEAAAEVAAALAESGLLAWRTDIAALGWLRTLWESIAPSSPGARGIALLRFSDSWDLAVVDSGGMVASLRSLGKELAPEALSRQILVSLLEAERGAGPRTLEFARLFVSAERARDGAGFDETLAKFAPFSRIVVDDSFGGVEGIAARIAEKNPLDITPASWAARRKEARFKRRLAAGVAAGLALWVAAVGAMIAGPMVYGARESAEIEKCNRHQKQYKSVTGFKSKVEFLERYAQRDRSAIESLLAVSQAMNVEDAGVDDLVLARFDYQRDAYRDEKGKKRNAASRSDASRPRVHMTGSALVKEHVYALKDALDGLMLESPGAKGSERVFPDVEIKGDLRETKGRFNYTIDAYFEKRETPAPPKAAKTQNGGGAK